MQMHAGLQRQRPKLNIIHAAAHQTLPNTVATFTPQRRGQPVLKCFAMHVRGHVLCKLKLTRQSRTGKSSEPPQTDHASLVTALFAASFWKEQVHVHEDGMVLECWYCSNEHTAPQTRAKRILTLDQQMIHDIIPCRDPWNVIQQWRSSWRPFWAPGRIPHDLFGATANATFLLPCAPQDSLGNEVAVKRTKNGSRGGAPPP